MFFFIFGFVLVFRGRDDVDGDEEGAVGFGLIIDY